MIVFTRNTDGKAGQTAQQNPMTGSSTVNEDPGIRCDGLRREFSIRPKLCLTFGAVLHTRHRHTPHTTETHGSIHELVPNSRIHCNLSPCLTFVGGVAPYGYANIHLSTPISVIAKPLRTHPINGFALCQGSNTSPRRVAETRNLFFATMP
jgi:hypothetical protein